MYKIHVGIDDTDSNQGMCTTYIASLIVDKLNRNNIKFLDYPKLIRLNPNIPWKTRGNAAIGLELEHDKPEEIFEICKKIVEKNSESKYKRADSGLVVLKGRIPIEIKEIAKRALHKEIKKASIKKLIKQHKLLHYEINSGRGLIGATSAIGSSLNNDHTYELLAYRKVEKTGKRKINSNSIIKMDRLKQFKTFSNIDHETKRILIVPTGKDPVLFGIRGENPKLLLKAFKMLKIEEKVERYTIFRTNHGTNQHIKEKIKLNRIKKYDSGYITGKVSKKPIYYKGGHMFFHFSDGLNEIKCAAYEPTKKFRNTVNMLEIGDKISVAGGIHKKTNNNYVLNLEMLHILKLVSKTEIQNPICNVCKKRMKSIGKKKGFECEKCGKEKTNKIKIKTKRKLKIGIYLPTVSAQRHLIKPLERYGKEKKKFNSKILKEFYKVC